MAAGKFAAIRRIPPGSETESAILFQPRNPRASRPPETSNAAERRRFVKAAGGAPADTRLFCLMLRWSRARISELLVLTPAAIDIEGGVACIPTIKRRKRGIIRQIPLPPNVLQELNRVFKLWIAQRDPQLVNTATVALEPHDRLALR
jgi:integrase